MIVRSASPRFARNRAIQFTADTTASFRCGRVSSSGLGKLVRRRDFITVIGAAAAAWPLTARAQQRALPVIGYLNTRAEGEDPQFLAAFRLGLKELGYVEGQNVAIEYRFAANRYGQLPAMAADLVQRQVTVIVANGPAVMAAKTATTSIPVVFFIGFDPVKFGLIASLDRPGGNLTGTYNLFDETAVKELELLHELVPSAQVIAALLNPAYPSADTQLKTLQMAADTLGLQLEVLHASTDGDLDTALASFVQKRAGALVVANDAFFISRSEKLGAQTARYAVPAIFQAHEFAVAGGLASYGSRPQDTYRLAGVYAGRILKGEKPGDMPVEQATKVELVINLRTAKALGLTVPLPVLGRADEVIE
jgi:putative tryptophan/tyrosine transport system substrate-binding protein